MGGVAVTTVRIRQTAVAGAFYPADAGQLRLLVDRCIAEGRRPPDLSGRLRALIVPHAGYVYSGPVAGFGYAQLAPLRDVVRHVVLLGPAHYVPVRGLAVPGSDAFATPLGPVRVDWRAREVMLTQPEASVDDVAHEPEHSLEVHLPFIQRALGDVEVLPVIVGRASAASVADALEPWVDDPESVVVVSSDLSHYLDYRSAQEHDRRTARAIVAREWSSIADDDACGSRPVRGLLELARRHDLEVSLLDLRNSGDTAGPHDRVVGYGSFAVVRREGA
jgi:MEMO1 family protein